jgi:ABC-type branched-subunit amino acid transport system substrate-binding protein
MRSIRRVALIVTVACVVAAVAAPVGSASGRAQKKKGDPVTIMTIGEFEVAAAGSANPEVSGAVEARAKAINRAGGLKDASGVIHKLKVKVCNTDNDPNKAEQCARDAADSGVAAVVGNFTALGSSVYPILEQAGIPSIGPTASEASTLTSPVAFSLQSGIPGIFFDMPQVLANAGSTKISLVYPDLPAAAQAVPLVGLAATGAGVEVVNEVSVPLDTADIAPQVAAATANGADGIMAVVIGDQTGRLVKGLSQAGYDGPITTASAFLTPKLLSELESELDGTFVVLNYPPASAKRVQGIRLFTRNMNAFDKTLGKTDSAVNAWLATYVFEQAAGEVDEITPANLLAQLNATTDVDTLGLTPTIDFTQPVKVTAFPLPRIFNPTVVDAKVKKGTIVSLKSPPAFVNPFE